MILSQRIRQALGIRGSEVSRVLWLVAHSLFVGVFAAFFLTAANALFLDRFEISYLPLAYIAAAALGYVALMAFSRVQRAVSIQQLLVLNLFVLLILTGAFWILEATTGSRWVVFLMFAWVGPAFALVSLGYWALASRLFDLRQGKRLFGLVGAGEEVATIASLFSVPLLLRYLDGPVGLLPLAAGGLVGCLVVVLAITRRLSGSLESEEEQPQGKTETGQGLGDLLRQRYFLLMAGLIVLLSLTNYVVDFGFLAQVRGRFQGPTEIAQFIGVFFGATKILELMLKVFLSGRLLSQFGLKFGLMALPAILAIVAGLAILIGTFGQAATHFFVLVALAKLVWVVLRTSTFEPTFRVLYQPVPTVDRLSFQTHVEGTARQLATGVVGVGLLLFSQGGSFNALYVFYALVPILAAWMVLNARTHRQYRAKLMESLKLRAVREAAPTALDVLRPELGSERARDRLVGLELLARLDASVLDQALEGMLEDPRPGVRQSALEFVGRDQRLELVDAVSATTNDDDPEVRSSAHETLGQLREIGALAEDEDRLEAMARSARAEERERAAVAIGRSPGASTAQLASLLFDRQRAVRRAALEAAGRRGQVEFLPQIVADLPAPTLAGTATAALIRLGEPALPELEKAFNKADLPLGVRHRILRIYESVGGERAHSLLLGKLISPERSLRHHALAALARGGLQASPEQAPTVHRAIESTVAEAAWGMASILDLDGEGDLASIREALQEEVQGARERIYRLLSLLHDPAAIRLVRDNLEGGSSEATVYALEIMDLLLSPDLKPLVLPLLEDLAYSQVLRRLEAAHTRQQLERLDRLSLIVNRPYHRIGAWTRACAVEAVGDVAPEVVPDLVASLFHPNPLVHEVAARTMLRLDPGLYRRHRATLPYDIREHLDYVVGAEGELTHWDSRSIFGRARLLRDIPAFSSLASETLVGLSTAADERVLKPHRRLPSPRAPRDSFYVLVDGEAVAVDEPSRSERETVPSRTVLAFGPGARALKVVETARFIRLEPEPLLEIAAENVGLIPALVRAKKALIEDGLEPGGSPGDPASEPEEEVRVAS